MSMKSLIALQLEGIQQTYGEVRLKCPQCNRNSLYLNLGSGMYICHRATCGLRPGLVPLRVRGPRQHNTFQEDTQPHRMPLGTNKEWKNLLDQYKHNSTLLNVFSHPAHLLPDQSYVTEVHDFYGELQGFVHRKDSRTPKSLTFCGNYCRLHFPVQAVGSRSLVLVEDTLSAERLSEYLPTAALLGSMVTKDQVRYLLQCGVSSLCLCLDDDATHKAIKIKRELGLMFKTSVVLCSPDPKDMNAGQLDELVTRIKKVHA